MYISSYDYKSLYKSNILPILRIQKTNFYRKKRFFFVFQTTATQLLPIHNCRFKSFYEIISLLELLLLKLLE